MNLANAQLLMVIDLRSYFISAGVPDFIIHGGCGHADNKAEKESNPKAHWVPPYQRIRTCPIICGAPPGTSFPQREKVGDSPVEQPVKFDFLILNINNQ
jgi:hypothetical protein